MARKSKKNIYHIIITSRGKQLSDIYQTPSELKVNKKLGELLEDNKKVIFPVKYINFKGIFPAEYEYVIIKAKQDGDPDVTRLRDDNGVFVNNSTTDEDWIVYERQPMLKEETFWVYGYHPRFQRKTFEWIFDNFIMEASKDKRETRCVVVFQNKLVVDRNGNLEIVMCKNKEDAVRMYNLIDEWCREKKLKYVIMGGDAFAPYVRKKWYDKLGKWTSWSWRKLSRNSLRP